MQNENIDLDLLFETSWEVCNKVGGIYTVLSTKAAQLHNCFGDKLIFIGPDIWNRDNPSSCFIERKTLLKNAAKRVVLPYDISIRVGRWNIPGSPIVVLVKYPGVFGVINSIYGEMWQKYGVDSLRNYGDYTESCAFAVASAIVIDSLTKYLDADPKKVIAHFDEWTTGMGLLYLKEKQSDIATVFTTHATSIGRSICSNGKPLYDYFNGYNGDQMAGELNMQSKHSLEKIAAHQADCFTTVSDVTGRECSQLLDIVPQVITPNGFEPSIRPESRKMNTLRKKGREKLLYIASLLRGGEKWNDKDTFIVATSGRHEFRNKGIDLYLDSLISLYGLRNVNQKKILALVLVPGWVKEPSGELIIDSKDNGHLKPDPDFITHRLNNEVQDEIVGKISFIKGSLSDDIQVIYVPCYLDGHDGIVNISYYNLLPALDLTIFPSYYEPWGYTPLESIAFGIPTVTSDKAGFGQWVLSEFERDERKGIYIIERTDSNYDSVCDTVASSILSQSSLTEKEIASEKECLDRVSSQADWKFFIKHYFEAFEIALKRRNDRLKQ